MLHPGGLRVAKNSKRPPANLATNISGIVAADQAGAAALFLAAEAAKVEKAAKQEEAAALLQQAAAEAMEAAIEAARPKKAADAPSRHGGYQQRALQMVPVGGTRMRYAGSVAASRVAEAEADAMASRIMPSSSPMVTKLDPFGEQEPPPQPMSPVAAHLSASETGEVQVSLEPMDEGAPGAAASDTAASEQAPREVKRQSLDNLYPNMAPPGTDGEQPVTLPPRAQRMSQSVPTDVYGNPRDKVAAPEVSEAAATANPNMRNLLLEVPYKRGVRTASVNQRYLTHEQTFDAAFELLPASASFGVLKAGSLYRLKLKLVNVSNLPQRFRFEAHGSAAAAGIVKLIYTPGVAAAGMAVPVEVEVGSDETAEVREVVTVLTEREEISLPISASILEADAYAEYLASSKSGQRKGPAVPRLVSTSLRTPGLHKTMAARVGDQSAGALRGLAPKTRGGSKPGDEEATPYKRPDFFAEPLSDGEEPEE